MSSKIYNFIFYYIHRSLVLVKDKNPVSSSSFVLATLLLFTLLGLVMLYEVIFKTEIIKILGGATFLIIYFILVFINLAFLTYNKKYEKICIGFKNYSIEEHKKNWRKSLGIMIGIFVFLIFAGICKATLI